MRTMGTTIMGTTTMTTTTDLIRDPEVEAMGENAAEDPVVAEKGHRPALRHMRIENGDIHLPEAGPEVRTPENTQENAVKDLAPEIQNWCQLYETPIRPRLLPQPDESHIQEAHQNHVVLNLRIQIGQNLRLHRTEKVVLVEPGPVKLHRLVKMNIALC